MDSMTFHSKIDAWLVIVMLGTGAVVVMMLYFSRAATSPLLALVIAFLTLGLPLWLLLTTDYTLTDRQLRVRSGPFRWQIPIVEIESWRRTHNPLSSPALSLDRVMIQYGARDTIMISPKDMDRFLQELERRRQILLRG